MTDEKFSQADMYRQSQERAQLKISEAKKLLARNCENTVISKFVNFYGNGKLAKDTAIELAQVDGPSSSTLVFEGKVTVTASVISGTETKQVVVPVVVKQNSLELPEDVDLRQLVDEAATEQTEQQSDVANSNMATISADLSQFSIEDDGSDRLKIFHPALDLGREIGIIHKEEYAILQDKEALLKQTLQDQLDDTVELTFEGKFIEPTIKTAEATFRKVNKQEVPEQVKELTEDETTTKASMGNSFRQSLEREELVVKEKKARLMNRLTNDLVSHLISLHYASVSVKAQTMSLQFDGNTFTGPVTIDVELISDAGRRRIEYPLNVTADTYRFARPEIVADFVSKGQNLEADLDAELEKETAEKLREVDEIENEGKQELEAALVDRSIKKKADGAGQQYMGPIDTLKVEKHLTNLPDDVKIGTVIYADGFYWQLTSKSESQLSKGANDGSLYTFTKVQPGKTEPEHKLSI